MKALGAFCIYLLLTHAIFSLGYRRLELLWMLPWLALDCTGSVLIRERFGATLSAKAWDARTHRWWGRAYRVIDAFPLFGADHCRIQYERERHYGSVWSAWAADWRGERFTAPPLADTTP